MPCQRITKEQYEKQSREFTRNAVRMLRKTDEFAQHQAVGEQQGDLKLTWVFGPFFLFILWYVDVVTMLTQMNVVKFQYLAGYALQQLPTTWGMVVCGWIIGFAAPMAMLVPWCGWHENLTFETSWVVIVHVIVAFFIAGSGLPMLDRPPFVQTTPELDFRSGGLTNTLLEWVCRAIPMLAPILPGIFLLRSQRKHWKTVQLIALPLLTVPMQFGFIAIPLWRALVVLARPVIVGNLRSPAMAWTFLFAELKKDVVELQTASNGAPVILTSFAAALIIYSSVLVAATFVVMPLVLYVVRSLWSLLPTSPRMWVLSVMSIVGAGCYLYVNHLLTVNIAAGLGAAVLVLLLNGFEG